MFRCIFILCLLLECYRKAAVPVPCSECRQAALYLVEVWDPPHPPYPVSLPAKGFPYPEAHLCFLVLRRLA